MLMVCAMPLLQTCGTRQWRCCLVERGLRTCTVIMPIDTVVVAATQDLAAAGAAAALGQQWRCA